MDAEHPHTMIENPREEPPAGGSSGGRFKPTRWLWGCSILFALVICAVVVGEAVYFFREGYSIIVGGSGGSSLRTATQETHTPTFIMAETIVPMPSPTLLGPPTATETGTEIPDPTATGVANAQAKRTFVAKQTATALADD